MATENKKTSKKLTKEERAKRKKKKVILLAVEVIIVVVLIAALYVVTKLDYIHHDDLDSDYDDETSSAEVDTDDETFLISESDIQMNDVSGMDGYRNIALFGVDSRNENLGKGSRSDTIIIASINESTKEVKLVSVYRDTYLNLGTDSYSKCNAAYSVGGPKQAINMLNMNLDLNITDYVTVGWSAVADTVDALGGIEIDVDSAEITHLNNYQVETSQSLGRSYTKLTSTGLVTLDGIQAVSYCRIRYTAGDDYKRTERQREVIQAIADVAKTMSFSQLNTIADTVFPQTATSLKLSEILELLQDINSYEIVATEGFPYATYRTTTVISGSGDCVIANDLESAVVYLHQFLFEDYDYEPSEAVKEYSAIIRNKAGLSQVYDGTNVNYTAE